MSLVIEYALCVSLGLLAAAGWAFISKVLLALAPPEVVSIWFGAPAAMWGVYLGRVLAKRHRRQT